MIRSFVVITLILLLTGCSWFGTKPKEDDLMRIKSEKRNPPKKVILLVADSLMFQAVDQGLRQNQLPTLKYFMDHGRYFKDVVSSFPTMSITIDSSLLTGTYPNQHHVPGLAWYSADEKRIINYGTGPAEIWNQGVPSVFKNLLIDLNGSHLNPKIPTLFEQLAQDGFTSASINGLIYRGSTEHRLTLPWWAGASSQLKSEIKVKGPDYFAFGALSNPLHGVVSLPDGLPNKLGFNNEFALQTAKYLIAQHQAPDFLLVYLPDLDKPSHRQGPPNMKGVLKLDKQLQSLMQVYGSTKEALKQAIFIVVGDSGVAQLLPKEQHPVISLPSLFRGYNLLRPGSSVTEKTDLALAVNETMAYVYNLKSASTIHRLINLAASEKRIDLTVWKENGWIHVIRNGIPGEFRFKASGPIRDKYGQKWTLGNHSEVLDLQIHADRLDYGLYPDALARLAGALNSHKGQFLVMTAKQGYEFAAQSSPKHEGGGGHGSLHAVESLIPMIISGTDKVPKKHRIIDIKNYIIRLLNEQHIS